MQSLQSAPEPLQAQTQACLQLASVGRHADMLAQARTLLPLLDGHTALRHQLLRQTTLSACELGAFDVALDAAHELSQTAKRSGLPQDALAASFLLAVCLERMGDSWQALRLLTEALAAYGSREPSHALLVASNAVCAISVGMAHRLRGTGDEAEAELQQILANGRIHGERALAMLQTVPGDSYDVAVPGNLGELRLIQGQSEAAQPLLMTALKLAHERGLAAHAWRVRTSLADWQLATGDAERARHLASGLLEEMGALAPQQTAIRAHDAAYRACRVLQLHEQALRHLESAERLDRQRTTSQLRSQSQLFVTRGEADRARALAERDTLTALGNRRHLERRAAELILQLPPEGEPLSLALVDLDHFKQVNDRHGHAAGDRVLVQLAQLLRDNTRHGDVLARHGGEEFVILLPGMGAARAQEVCERLRQRVAAHAWGLAAADTAITVSIGLACTPPFDLADLLARADAALYRAKNAGRNNLVLA